MILLSKEICKCVLGFGKETSRRDCFKFTCILVPISPLMAVLIVMQPAKDLQHRQLHYGIKPVGPRRFCVLTT